MLSANQLERAGQAYSLGYRDAYRNWHGPRQYLEGTFGYYDYFKGVAYGARQKSLSRKLFGDINGEETR